MTSIPSPLSFLESVTGYNQYIAKAENPSANAPIRLAVIDPSYAATSYPGTLPRVTFEGEETLTDKRYVVIDRAYQPGPSDRVVMLPVGHTYVIAGVITPAVVAPIFDHETVVASTSTASTTYVSLTGGPSATINLRDGQYAEVIVSCSQYIAHDLGTLGGVMSFRSTGASGTVEAVDENGTETGVYVRWGPAERTTIWGPASSAGSHTFEARYKVINSTTGHFKNRRVIAKAL